LENKKTMKKIITVLLTFIVSLSLFAKDLPSRPNPPTLVTDYANILSKNEKAQLESKLVDYFASTSTQIAVVTVPTLDGNEISDYAFKLGEKWGIGDKKFNNGILVLVKPKSSASRGQAYIAVGYGLEGAVPDATSKQIIENEMIPFFKANNMYGGINSATNVLIDITAGEYNHQQYAKNVGSAGGFNPFILIILIFFVFPMLFGRRRRGMYSAGGRGSSLPFLLALGMLGGSRRGHSGMYNDFSSGSGSFGGGGNSFGGFGGFGGGGFGGGGAGGSW
jgi:uncharacterized protein